MNRQQVNQKLEKIQSEFDVNSIVYRAVEIWPLLRLDLVHSLSVGIKKMSPEVPFCLNKSNEYISNYSKRLQDAENQALRKELRKYNFIFFMNSCYREQLNSDSIVHRHFHGLHASLPKSKKLGGIEFNDDGNSETQSLSEDVYDVNFVLWQARLNTSLKIRQLHLTQRPLPKIENLIEFIDYLSTENVFFFDNLTNIKRKILYLFELSTLFTELLADNKIDLLFINRFYNVNEMAICLAARRLKIKTVELQHGHQNDSHHYYTNWARPPIDGHKLLPKVFWTWNDKSTQRLDSSFGKSHTIETLGSVWFENWRRYVKKASVNNRDNEFFALVAWQPMNVDWFTEEFSKLVCFLPSKINWLFRFHSRHPLTQRHRSKVVQKLEELRTKFQVNIEWEDASESPLYTLIEKANVCLTQYSSVASECVACNIPAILLLNEPEAFAADFTENGYIKCKDIEDAIDAFSNLNKVRFDKAVIADFNKKLIGNLV